VLDDRDEITLITLYRRLPKKLRDIHREMLAVQTETSQLAERRSDVVDRRELTP
jgi:hypothetical protein